MAAEHAEFVRKVRKGLSRIRLVAKWLRRLRSLR